MLHAIEGADDIGPDAQREAVRGNLGERRRHRPVRCVVDRKVESAELFNALLDHTSYGILFRDVSGYSQHAPTAVAELGCGLLQPVVAPGSDHYGGTGVDERRRNT